MLRSWMADRVGKVPGRKPEAAAGAASRFDSCAIRQCAPSAKVVKHRPDNRRNHDVGRASQLAMAPVSKTGERRKAPSGSDSRSFRS